METRKKRARCVRSAPSFNILVGRPDPGRRVFLSDGGGTSEVIDK